jgi:hypothetical protein
MKLVALLLGMLFVFPAAAQAEKKIWTKTRPAINVTHIFQGEINRRGKPTGYHALYNGKPVDTARVVKIKGKPNKAGVYTAQVEILDRKSGKWKGKFSSMFPDRMKPEEILKAVLHAYNHRKKGKSTPWRGPSGHGFPIEGYLLKNGKINTAYPIYIRDRKK